MVMRRSRLMLALALAAVTLAAHRAMPPARPADPEGRFVPRPEVARLLAFGFEPVLADFHWLQAVQIVEGHLLAAGKRVLRRADEDHRFFAPHRRLDRPAGAGIADKPQIDLIGLDQLVDPPRVLILNADVGLRILAQKVLNKPVHVRQADRINRSDTDAAGDFLVQCPHLFFEGKIPLDELAAALVIHFPFSS